MQTCTLNDLRTINIYTLAFQEGDLRIQICTLSPQLLDLFLKTGRDQGCMVQDAGRLKLVEGGETKKNFKKKESNG